MKALAVVEEVDPRAPSWVSWASWKCGRQASCPQSCGVSASRILFLVMICFLYTSQATVCQNVDGLESCTEGPDGFIVSVSGSAQGNGLVESDFSVDDAQILLSSIHDPYPTAEDWSFVLAMHGFDVPSIGVLRADNRTWQVFENGSIFERLV